MPTTCTKAEQRKRRVDLVEAKIISDAGAYSGYSPSILEQSMVFAGGPYQWSNVRIEGYCVYTNNVLGGPFRGFGVNQVHFALESHIDAMARKLKMDPFELRLKNALDLGSMTVTGERLKSSVAVKETIKRARQALNGVVLQRVKGKMGMGLPPAIRTWEREGKCQFCRSPVELTEDGEVLISASAVDMGQGVRTVLAQIASAITGIDYNKINVLVGDTLLVPPGVGAYAQRQTYVTGNAVLGASMKFREKLVSFVSKEFGIEESRVRIEGEKVVDAKIGKDLATIYDLARLACDRGEEIKGQSEYHAPKTYPIIGDNQAVHPLARDGAGAAFDTLTSRLFVDESNREEMTEDGHYPENYKNYFTYNYVTQVAIVEVNKKMGDVKLVLLISAHDVGKMINPQRIKGQLEGSALMGMGYALKEQFVMRDGWNVTDSLRKCGVPTIEEIPE
jgi:CO/xanthine dehydrogenase Mo-binding subunit